MSVINVETLFSYHFLIIFPPIRSSRNKIAYCANQKGVMWTPIQKETIYKEIIELKVPTRTVASYLQVHEGRLYKLISIKKNGGIFSEVANRPSKIDEVAKLELHNKIELREIQQKAMKKTTDIKPYMMELTAETNLRRGGVGLNTSISQRTIDRVIESVHVSFEQGQTTTEARAREKRDFRNMVSMAAANYAFAKDKSYHLIVNFDATQYIISEKNNEVVATVKLKNSAPTTTTETSTLDQCVKWMMICNAAGIIGTDVFLISDPTMEVGKFDFYPIMGLTHCNMSGAGGYLCVANSRSGN